MKVLHETINSSFKKVLLLSVTILGLFLAHISYLSNGFTWLDHGDIERGRAIVSLAEIPKSIFARFGHTGFYRPVVTSINSIDHALYGSWAPGYHLTNVLLHLAVAALSYPFLSLFFKLSSIEGLLVIALVGLSPVHFLPVGAISYRQELLFVLFVMLALISYSKARYSRRGKWIIISSAFAFFAYLSKETAVILIPLIILIWEAFHRSNLMKISRYNSKILLSQLSAIGLYAYLRITAVPEIWNSRPAVLSSFNEAIGTRLYALGRLILQLFYPMRPSLSDATPILGIENPLSLLTIALLIALSLYLLRKKLTTDLSRTAALLSVSLIPALNIVPVPRFSSPHYGYIASVFAAVLIIFFIRKIHKYSLLQTNISYIFITLYIIVLTYTTFTSGFLFKNDRTLFETEVLNDPNYREGHAYLGDFFQNSGELERSQLHYEGALRQIPGVLAFADAAQVRINFAGLRVRQNQLQEADMLLSQVSVKKTSILYPTVIYNRAMVAHKMKDFKRAVTLLSQDGIDWQFPEAILLWADALRNLNREKEAQEVLQKFLPYIQN